MNLKVGQCYFFQTATKDWVGRLKSIDGPYTVTLTHASWVAESGRLHEFLRDGQAEGMEIEPTFLRSRRNGEVYVKEDVTLSCQWVNFTEWDHPLFTEAV